jgi:hypothetical protein
MGNGLAIRPPPAVIPTEVDPTGIAAVNAPVTLFPSPFPRQCFAQAKAVQKTYNELYAFVSRDEEFISDVVQQVMDGDDFIRNLWDIHLKVKEEGYTQVRHMHPTPRPPRLTKSSLCRWACSGPTTWFTKICLGQSQYHK